MNVTLTPEEKARRVRDELVAWEVRKRIMEDENALDMARLHAADFITERVLGKVEQKVSVRQIRSLADLTDDELAALTAEIAQRSARMQGTDEGTTPRIDNDGGGYPPKSSES